MDVEVLEIVLAMVHLMPDLLNFDQVATDAIDAVHVNAFCLDGCDDVVDKQWHAPFLAPTQADKVGTENALLKFKIQVRILRLNAKQRTTASQLDQ